MIFFGKKSAFRPFVIFVAINFGIAFLLQKPAFAEVKLTGLFIATKECPANKKLQSDNPGDIKTVVGEEYQLRAKNKDQETHYRLFFPQAPVTDQRWVSKDCGLTQDLVIVSGSTPPANDPFRLVTISGNFAASKSCPALRRTDAEEDGVFFGGRSDLWSDSTQ